MKKDRVKSWISLAMTWLVVFGSAGSALSEQSTKARYFREEPMRITRAKWQPPDEIMDAIGLKSGMVVGEIGSGACGGFSYYLAERVGEGGKVYANDINEQALKALLKGMKAQDFHNVEIVLGLDDNPSFASKSLDMAIMVNMFHFFDHPVELLDNILPSLKPGASVVIVDSKSRKASILNAVRSSHFQIERIETWPKRDNIIVLIPKFE